MLVESTKPTIEQDQKTRRLPPFRVILHNDDVNTVDHVVRTIVKLTPLNTEEAVARTLEAHETGSSMLLVTHKERAELYVEQFASCKLNVTCEPDS
ncbi:MAG: ATP-dependent Clp protease adaptor ClpS [Phycisphaerae bacterium]|nr:ATP-dependent Clp protease adaptor ClpS [Phycisphaerae bacterium]